MGRHSIPDPDDQPDEQFGVSGDPRRDEPAAGSSAGQHEQPEFGYDTDDYRYETNAGYDEPRRDDYADHKYEDHEYEDPDPAPRGFPAVADEDSPTQAFSVTGRQRTFEGGEWTGSHRAITTGRRTVSRGVVIALITVVAVVGAVILWQFFGNALSDRSQASADRCVEGEVTVAVVADPAIAEQISAQAQDYVGTNPRVGDRCVKVAVTAADADAVIAGFSGDWPGDLGERPAVWLPGSSSAESRLEAAAGPESVIDSRSLVSSPVVLAVRPELKTALSEQNWSALPNLQTNPAGLDGLNLPGWGGLRLALPTAGNSDAGILAAEAVAAASAAPNAPVTSGAGAAQRLMGAQPELADKQASTALDALVNAADPAAAPVHAVATTEQQVFRRGADTADAGSKLSAWIPAGPTPVADFPVVLLSGERLAKEQVSAASEFDRFMRKPEQLAKLAEAGFRADGASNPDSPVTDFAAVTTPLSFADPAERAGLAARLAAPVQDGTVTVMLGQSVPGLTDVAAALNDRLQQLPPSAAVGLWTFDGVAGRSAITTGPLGDDLGGTPRSAALGSSLQSQGGSASGAVSFTTLRLVYGDALAGFRPDQPNSVLVVTAGPHTDRSLDGAGLISYIQGAANPQRPVAVNVINIGDDPDRATWEAVAQASGGQYRNVTGAADPAFGDAVSEFLG